MFRTEKYQNKIAKLNDDELLELREYAQSKSKGGIAMGGIFIILCGLVYGVINIGIFVYWRPLRDIPLKAWFTPFTTANETAIIVLAVSLTTIVIIRRLGDVVNHECGKIETLKYAMVVDEINTRLQNSINHINDSKGEICLQEQYIAGLNELKSILEEIEKQRNDLRIEYQQYYSKNGKMTGDIAFKNYKESIAKLEMDYNIKIHMFKGRFKGVDDIILYKNCIKEIVGGETFYMDYDGHRLEGDVEVEEWFYKKRA